ncbi:hypothetical protein G7085_08035 [Tessaracoccus sp. HDW20]|uniref:hypothetical protein n=1 Tax=Tessaracoccus coleopterorum TaxID=2714950 RepID=UPI0018D3B75F|nr:hypothetical protein [Tessaracoccus coleopterorum]NHB84575.1 hypothetical protein [Tessaracoccus coleopterorum]
MVEDHRDLVVIAHAAIQVALQATLGAIPEAIGGFAAFVDPLRLRAATLEAAEPHSAVELRMNAASLELLLVLLDDTVPAHLRIEPLQILAERMQDDPPWRRCSCRCCPRSRAS